LQINAWRNANAVLPQAVIVIIALIIAALLLRIAWRNIRPLVRRSEFSNVSGFNIVIAVILTVVALAGIVIAVTGGDFHIKDWPTQLEPAKYERFVFGILLIVMMIFRPAGLMPEGRRRLELQASKAEKQTGGGA